MADLTAIVLSGGKGQRLRPLTDDIPKSMVRLNRRPLLDYLLRYLAAEGVSRFVICTGYKAEIIEQFIRDTFGSPWNITCVDSGDVGMPARLLDARRLVTGQTLICYGDTLANVQLAALRECHQTSGALATLTAYPLRSPFGIVSMDEAHRVTKFVEKPCLPYWINIGFLLCEPGAFNFLRPESDMVAFFDALAGASALFAYPHRGQHITVNTEKDLAEAETQMVDFFTLLDGHSL